jgi:prepilin-type processing-associated H-X9-DG protein
MGARRDDAAVDDALGIYDGGGWLWAKTDYAANALVVPNRPAVFSISMVSKGTSATILIGEKAMDPRNYNTGTWYWDEPYFSGGSGGTQRGPGSMPGEGLQVLRDDTDMGLSYRGNWGSAHRSACQFLYVDGSVQGTSYQVSPDVMNGLLTP